MKISKKCQYALKALFELAWRDQGEPIRTCDVAKAQRISLRFMEIILNQLKHGGFVKSKRGNEGGYMLARNARYLTVREIIEYIEGPISLAQSTNDTASIGNEAFTELWQQVNNAVCEVCENKNFADLVKFERTKRDKRALNYSI
jgi:Rrf2 family protein